MVFSYFLLFVCVSLHGVERHHARKGHAYKMFNTPADPPPARRRPWRSFCPGSLVQAAPPTRPAGRTGRLSRLPYPPLCPPPPFPAAAPWQKKRQSALSEIHMYLSRLKIVYLMSELEIYLSNWQKIFVKLTMMPVLLRLTLSLPLVVALTMILWSKGVGVCFLALRDAVLTK